MIIVLCLSITDIKIISKENIKNVMINLKLGHRKMSWHSDGCSVKSRFPRE